MCIKISWIIPSIKEAILSILNKIKKSHFENENDLLTNENYPFKGNMDLQRHVNIVSYSA